MMGFFEVLNEVKNLRLYQRVADELRTAKEFKTPKQIADAIGLNSETGWLKVRNSITRARESLAREGVFIVNTLKRGYKVGTVEEFVVEGNKASKRAVGHLKSMANLINVAQQFQFDERLVELQRTTRENAQSVVVLLDQRPPGITDSDWTASLTTKPEEVDLDPYENLGDDV